MTDGTAPYTTTAIDALTEAVEHDHDSPLAGTASRDRLS